MALVMSWEMAKVTVSMGSGQVLQTSSHDRRLALARQSLGHSNSAGGLTPRSREVASEALVGVEV